jgi:hypothetical protein
MPANKSKKYFFSAIDLQRYSQSSFLVTGPHPRRVPGHALAFPPEYFISFVSFDFSGADLTAVNPSDAVTAETSRLHFSIAAEHSVL